MRVAVGLGGNTPQTRDALKQVRQSWENQLDKVQFSSLYRTKPQDDLEQADFWNAVMLGEWSGTPLELLDILLTWELQSGRVRNPLRPKGPRVLDLDLLLFGPLVLTSERLTLPHPRMSQRAFVLIPLLELLPESLDPRNETPWSLALTSLGDQGVVMAEKTW